MKRTLSSISLLLVTLSLGGCMVGPKYKRPAVAVPPTFRGSDAPEVAQTAAADTLGDQKWAEVFHDPVLQQLIHEALENNYDVRIAAARVLEAQDQVGITRAGQFPTLSGGGSYNAIGLPSGLLNGLNKNSNGGSNYGNSTNYFAGGVTMSAAWNLDFWGLYRSQTAEARAQLLASEWGRRVTTSTIVENVATGYIQLRSLDAQLELTKQTIETRKESLQLTETLERGGSTSLADVRQAEELLYTAEANVPELERQIAREEDSLSTLLGRNPGTILRGQKVTEQAKPEAVPVGLPSQLVERRPDIQQAEAQLVAANANIGVAKAQLFPQIALSGTGGTSSSQLKSLFDSKNAYWYTSGSLTQTIFDGGKLRNNLRLSKAQEQEQVLTYQKTIQNAFQDVSDSLTDVAKYRTYREADERLTASAQDATRLARLRYNGGSTSYLEVLTNDTTYFSDELSLVNAQANEALSLVRLYSALGGGWQQ